MTEIDWARSIQKVASETEAVRLGRRLREALARNERLAGELLNHRVRVVREVAIPHIVAVLGVAAVPSLVDRFRREGDPDIRSELLRLALELDPDRVRTLLPRVRRQLEASDSWDVIDAMWALLALRDGESLSDLDRIASEQRRYATGRIASIVTRALRGDSASLATQLLSHDHDASSWLGRATFITRAPDLVVALAQAVTELPDEECREQCRGWLEDIESLAGTRQR